MHVWGATAGSRSSFRWRSWSDTYIMRCLWSASQTSPRFYLQVKVLRSHRPSLWSTGREARTWCLTKGCCKTINLWYLTSLGNVCDVLPATSGTSPLKLSWYFAFMVCLFGTHHTSAVISVSFQEYCHFAWQEVECTLLVEVQWTPIAQYFFWRQHWDGVIQVPHCKNCSHQDDDRKNSFSSLTPWPSVHPEIGLRVLPVTASLQRLPRWFPLPSENSVFSLLFAAFCINSRL